MATQTVTGTVYAVNGKAVSGAMVTCKNLNNSKIVASVTSDSSGKFTFTDTVGGDYLITATKSGYEDLTTTLDNTGGMTTKSGLQY
jgi:Carboxypeptidase regulatory-like domain